MRSLTMGTDGDGMVGVGVGDGGGVDVGKAETVGPKARKGVGVGGNGPQNHCTGVVVRGVCGAAWPRGQAQTPKAPSKAASKASPRSHKTQLPKLSGFGGLGRFSARGS